MMTPTIHNFKFYAVNHRYIVCSVDDNAELWFYGAFDDWKKSHEVARIISGVVIAN